MALKQFCQPFSTEVGVVQQKCTKASFCWCSFDGNAGRAIFYGDVSELLLIFNFFQICEVLQKIESGYVENGLMETYLCGSWFSFCDMNTWGNVYI